MFSRRQILHWFSSGLLLPFLPGCDQPETELALENLGPILPYIQNVTTESAIFLWQSSGKKVGTVEVFNENGSLANKNTDSLTSFHEVLITDLTPDTLYFYQVKEGSFRVGPLRSFRTAPASDSTNPFSFIVFGDSGLGTEPQLKVASQMLALANNASFAIHTGDVVYDGYEAEYRSKYFEPYRSLIHRIPFYPVLGDHDLVDGAAAFYKFFSLPPNNHEDTEDFYSFSYGNAVFVALNSNRLLGYDNVTQLPFAEEVLGNSTHTWKFIFLQHSIYTTAVGRDSKPGIGSQVGPIAEKYGVQFVFGGDVHAYERFNARQDFTSSEEGSEVVYITSGGGGAELRDLEGGAEAAVSKSVYHFMHVSIDDKELNATVYDFNGNVIDTFGQTAS
ncbi:MAG: metallophosphoesterase family protein [SAR324 cluster bacterium]|nr:metallophosphoesterase family protein [SAR324 cluster bacterium]